MELAITSGIGSDHVDLPSAIERGLTVAEVTYCNSISVAEHTIMQVLAIVRDYLPQYRIVVDGGWSIADAIARCYDLEGMDVGVFAAGRIGRAVLERLAPFDVKLHYTDRFRLPADVEKRLHLTWHDHIHSLVQQIDVLTVHAPLTEETRGLLDDTLLSTFRRGSYIVNPARGARHAAGAQEIPENFFAGTPIRNEYLIVDAGGYAGTGAHSYAAQPA